jgi:PAS domain S-box-containing protein
MSGGALRVAADGTILYCNAYFARLLERPLEEILGRHLADFLSAEERTRWARLLAAASEGARTEEFTLVTSGGASLPVRVSVSPLDQGGPQTKSLLVMDLSPVIRRDITKRKEAEQRMVSDLIENNRVRERLRGLAEAMPQLVWGADAAGELDFVSRQAIEYGGLGPEEVQGWKWTSVVHAEDLEPTLAAWRQALATGASNTVEHRLRRHDGEYRWHLTRAVALRNEQGKITRWVGTSTDIHHQKLAEEELERRVAQRTAELAQSRTMLETVTSHAPLILFATDAQGIFTVYTGQAITAAGHTQGEFLGKHFSEAPTYDPHSKDHIRQALEGVETKVIGHGLEGSTYETSFAPRRDGQGNVTGMVGVSVDVSERVQREEEIRNLNESLERRVSERTAELEATNLELEAFSYSVSHDLRAPLRHVDGFSRLLEEIPGAAPSPEAQQYLGRIRDATARMGQMIDALLNLSRLGRQPLRLHRTNLGELAEQVQRDLQMETEGREIEWKIGPLPSLLCDANLIRQVLTNLLSNAVKFTSRREHAVIEVGAKTSDGRPVIFVRDNGVGFNSRSASKLFGAFQRLHSRNEFEGSGVGLATVQRIVHRHGGRVWAEAEVGKGATFYFSLGNG